MGFQRCCALFTETQKSPSEVNLCGSQYSQSALQNREPACHLSFNLYNPSHSLSQLLMIRINLYWQAPIAASSLQPNLYIKAPKLTFGHVPKVGRLRLTLLLSTDGDTNI